MYIHNSSKCLVNSSQNKVQDSNCEGALFDVHTYRSSCCRSQDVHLVWGNQTEGGKDVFDVRNI